MLIYRCRVALEQFQLLESVCMVSLNHYFPFSLLVGFLSVFCGTAVAYQDDIDHTKLANELGINTPDGSGVLVCQVEVDTSDSTGPLYTYSPDPANTQFTGKTITDISNVSNGYSSHATSVGAIFYGSSAVASGVNDIHVYLAYSPVQSGDTPIYSCLLYTSPSPRD